MLIFLYILVLAAMSLYGVGALKHLMLVRKIEKLQQDAPPLIASMGRKLKAFTIEKSETICICKSVAPDFFSRLIAAVADLIGLSNNAMNKDYAKYAYIMAFHDLLQKVGAPNYLINFEQKVAYRRWSGVTVTLSATAVYMYADTLSLFPTPEGFASEKLTVSKRSSLVQLIAVAMTTVLIFVGINIAAKTYTNNLVQTIPLETEEVLWSYIEDSVLKSESDRLDISKASASINASIQDILVHFPTAYGYKYRVYIIDDEEADIKLYPAGAIVLTKGFIEELESINEVEYILLHIISHYENRDHLEQIQDKLISLNFLAKIFGKGSWVGRLLVWKSAFDPDYTLVQEIQADEMALSVQNTMHGEISGIDVFEQQFYAVTNSYSRIYNSHPFQVERKDAVNEYIQKHNLVIGKDFPLPFTIEKSPPQSKLINETLGATDEYLDLFNNYRKQINTLYADYTAFLSPYSNTLNFTEALTLLELNEKKKALTSDILKFKDYRSQFRALLRQNDENMRKFISAVEDNNQKRNQYSMWDNEYTTVSGLMEFYLTRDQKILEEQLIIVNFLILRYGTYKVTKFGIEFLTAKEKSDYMILQKRLDQLIKQPPDTNVQKR